MNRPMNKAGKRPSEATSDSNGTVKRAELEQAFIAKLKPDTPSYKKNLNFNNMRNEKTKVWTNT